MQTTKMINRVKIEKSTYRHSKYLRVMPGLVVCLIFLSSIFSSCKEDILEEPKMPEAKMIKAIKVVKGEEAAQNYIVNYNQHQQVAYFGSADFKSGYTYSYTGTQINKIVHNVGNFQYSLVLNYSNHTLLDGEFQVKNSSGLIKSFPLTCEKTGDFITIATNTNDLIYLELQVRDGKLIKALTNAWFLKTSISFQYNEQKHRIYGNTIPLFPLKNPFSQDTAFLVNELISLSLQAISQKQLVAFQSLNCSATLNYIQKFGEVMAIKCQSDSRDADGNFIETVKTDITYSYVD